MSKYYETREFKNLKQEWYEKLDQEGFYDIETFKSRSGEFRENPYPNQDVKNLYMVRKNLVNQDNFEQYRHQTFLYYSGCRNFLAHSRPLPFLDDKILKLHAEGLSIRKIRAVLDDYICRYPRYKFKGKYKTNFSKSFVHQRIQHIKELVTTWNATSEHGIRFEDYEEPDE